MIFIQTCVNILLLKFYNFTMPNKKSAKKELRKSDKRRVVNQKTKNDLKQTIKSSFKRINSSDPSVKNDLPKLIKEIDKAVKKKIIKKNNAARKKSRLMKNINKLS